MVLHVRWVKFRGQDGLDNRFSKNEDAIYLKDQFTHSKIKSNHAVSSFFGLKSNIDLYVLLMVLQDQNTRDTVF